MTKSKRIELLSPAKNAEVGMAAIDHGADAVYIGAPRFGARSAAGNSEADIETLVRYAHRFNARVYVALNTILKDEELPDARQMAYNLYNIGADALIVQDMALLQMDLPPIALHASTQTDNRTVDKVRFLESAGFSQIVLARELSLEQIRAIASETHVPLEVFIHGALCVSYSGQCYLSHTLCGRSANRGECAQYCRLPYSLVNADGETLIRDKHLLSLKDLNRGDQLEALLDAGVTSLKIEGRLKDISYVKNITAYYRRRLDDLFTRRPEYVPASAGHTTFSFTPDPLKSFNRGFTPYFLNGRDRESVVSQDTPKSMGERIGVVKEVSKNSFTIAGLIFLNNGDGLCFLNDEGVFEGFRVNRADENRIFPAEMPIRLRAKMPLYRNYDHEFEKELAKKSAERTVYVDMSFYETPVGFALQLQDERGVRVILPLNIPKEVAKNSQRENIVRQLSRLGGTDFELRDLKIDLTGDWFIPSSQLAELRRLAIERLTAAVSLAYRPEKRKAAVSDGVSYPDKQLTYLGNVTNADALRFYLKHGVEEVAPAFELKVDEGVPLMFTRHCIKYLLGACPKGDVKRQLGKEPLYLLYRDTRLRLEFDCRKCEMRIFKASPSDI